MTIYPTVKCPYCGNEFTVSIDKKELAESLHIFRCDMEEHLGCGLPFVVGVELKPVVSVLRIEGMADVLQDEINERELATHALPRE